MWIAGAGMTRFGKREESLPALMAEASALALADAGIERPGSIVVAAMNPEEFTGEGNFGSLIATHLGLSHVPTIRVETATSSGMAAVYAGYVTIAAGLQDSVLVVGGEKMTHLPTPRVSEIIGRSIDAHERSYGSTMPALAGPHHPRGDAAPRAHAQGDLPGRRQEPRARRAEPVRALPGARARSRR